MSNELFIAFGVASGIAVVAALGIWLFFKRGSHAYSSTWFICFIVLLLLVATYTWTAFAAYNEGPRKGGSLNPGGPSGPTLGGMLVLASATILAPASYVFLLVLSLLPPSSLGGPARRRIRVYGCLVAVIAAIVSLACLTALSGDIREDRDKSKERRIKMFNASIVSPGQELNSLSAMKRNNDVSTIWTEV